MADAVDDLLPLLGLNPEGEGEEDDSGSNESSSSDEDMHEEDVEMSNEDEDGESNEENRQRRIYDRGKERRKKDTDKLARKRSSQKIVVNFDQSLPGAHSYLGSDLEEMRGRTILEESTVVTVPLVVLPNVVLVPGQVIPLQLYNQQLVAVMRRVADSDKTFGVINMSGLLSDTGQVTSSIGCTAEIFSMKDEMDEASGISMVRVKARGRQRFKAIDVQSQITGELLARVKILPEVSLTHALDGCCLPSHRRLMLQAAEDDDMVKTAVDRQGRVLASVDLRTKQHINRLYSANFTWWPSWVYKMYDIEWLAEQIGTELGSWSSTSLPSDPVDLSFWVAHNLPVDDQTRLFLLSFDSVVQRLRFGLSIIRKSGFLLSCNDCEYSIANRNHVFSMSQEGPLGAYVNPGGYVHEMFTVLTVTNLRNIGGSSTEHSWFPGYAWTIVQCKNCHAHMGWMFTATNKSLSPRKFWGLCRSSVKTTISTPSGENEEEPVHVM